MKMRWLGQASFHITSGDGLAIRTDPYDSSLGFELSPLPADIVTVSHDHFAHAAVDTVPGGPAEVQRPGEREVAGVRFLGVESFHDDAQGLDRGTNTIFVFTVDGVRICHLGDLGHLLTEEQLGAIGAVDLLCVPVGGIYTLDARGASQVMGQLSPRITVPMQYKGNGLQLPIEGLRKFLRGKSNVRTHATLEVRGESLPNKPVVVVMTLSVPMSGC